MAAPDRGMERRRLIRKGAVRRRVAGGFLEDNESIDVLIKRAAEVKKLDRISSNLYSKLDGRVTIIQKLQ